LRPLEVGADSDFVTHLQARFGFQDEPNVPRALRVAVEQGLLPAADLEDVTYFLYRIILVPGPGHEMPAWQRRLFLAIAHNAANPAEYFGLPIDRCISMGAQIPV